MTTLSIDKFACIQSGELELAQLTFIIGPQASGKSIVSKLIYFFNDITSKQYNALDDGLSFDDYKKFICKEFCKTFPPQAWGPTTFEIKYKAGPIEFLFQRPRPRKNSSTDKLNLNCSPSFEDHYPRLQEQFSTAKAKLPKSGDETISINREFDLIWQIREASEKVLAKELKKEFVESQLFIPAGRSFFTTVGKAFVAFEQVSALDPFTTFFGQLFARLRERAKYRMIDRPARDKELSELQIKLTKEFFGGEVRFGRNEDYVATADGRKLQFPNLSSGQQELLPLWQALNDYGSFVRHLLVLIEEPEAHLFPAAQSNLIEYIASLSSTLDRRVIITTHSPYVLAKINNLLKAGLIAAKLTKAKQAKLEFIIPRIAWLKPGSTKAYAIVNRSIQPLIDEEGLIDGDYLDGVSRDIADQYSDLIELELGL